VELQCINSKGQSEDLKISITYRYDMGIRGQIKIIAIWNNGILGYKCE
jgi:hypothetical protein